VVADTAIPPLVLGSASPRRSALLDSLGVPFGIETVEIDEQALVAEDLTGRQAVIRIARAKFEAFDSRTEQQLLLTADTLVECDGKVLGKPASSSHVGDLLHHMSGRPIHIFTAVCLGERGHEPAVTGVSTTVHLRPLDDDEIDAYVRSDVGLDKAGGLALQSEARGFIESVDGCWANVVGLPLCAVAAAMDLDGSGRTQAARCVTDLCGAW